MTIIESLAIGVLSLIRFDSTAEAPPQEARLAPAIVRVTFRTIDEVDQVCSGAVVSDDGAILTATHCSQFCSRGKGAPADPAWDCRLTVNEGPRTRYKILVYSECNLDSQAEKLRDFWRRLGEPPEALDLAQEPCARESDVALLVPFDPVEPVACMPIARANRPIGAPISAAGYPMRTTRFGSGEVAAPGDGDGVNLRFTRGQVVSQPWCDVVSDPGGSPRRIEFIPRWIGMTRAPHLIQSTADLVFSASGGPLFDPATGLIHGVGSKYNRWYQRPGQDVTVVHGENQECAGATFFASASALEPMARAQGVLDQVESLRCDRRRILPEGAAL